MGKPLDDPASMRMTVGTKIDFDVEKKKFETLIGFKKSDEEFLLDILKKWKQ